MKATIKTAWFWRKHEDSPELLEAWDEFSVDANPDGWHEAVDKAFDAAKSDDSGYGLRFIDIRIDYDVVEKSFLPAEIEGVATQNVGGKT